MIGRIRALVAAGNTAEKIGAIMGGLTKNTIVGAAWRAGIRLHTGGTDANHPRLGASRSRSAGVRQPQPPPPSPPLPEPRGCRWIEGHPNSGDDYAYCDERVVGPERSWCAAHRARVYLPPRQR